MIDYKRKSPKGTFTPSTPSTVRLVKGQSVNLTALVARTAVVGTVLAGSLGGALPAAQAHGPAQTSTTVHYVVKAEEDGSGRITRTVHRGARTVLVSRWKADSYLLPWDCQTMGNKRCGANADPDVVGQQTRHLVIARHPGMTHDVALTMTTTPRGTIAVTARIATDEDVEGEVLN